MIDSCVSRYNWIMTVKVYDNDAMPFRQRFIVYFEAT